MTALKAKDQKPTNVFFEDAIAKAILFRTAEEVYGRQPKAIGDLRYVTVPYTLAWLSKTLNGRLDLLKIWRQQRVSDSLRTLLYELMVAVEGAIKSSATGALYGEWAKKEDCWKQLRSKAFILDMNSVQADLIDPSSPPVRKTMSDDDAEKLQQQNNANWLCSLPALVWDQLAEWGRIAEKLSLNQQGVAADIAKRIRQWRDQTPGRLTANEINTGLHILDVVLEQAPQLLENRPDDAKPEPATSESGELPITVELIQKAVAWDRRNRILSVQYHVVLKDIAEGRKTLNTTNAPLIRSKISLLIKHGFVLNQ